MILDVWLWLVGEMGDSYGEDLLPALGVRIGTSRAGVSKSNFNRLGAGNVAADIENKKA